MKNETAKREIESLDYYLQNHTDDYSEESHTAMMMAVKALEQEPKTDSWSIKDVADTFKKHGLIREQEPCEDWYDVPSDEMTLEQARQAVKDLRKKLAEYLEQEPCPNAISRQAVLDCFTATKLKKFDFILNARAEIKKLPSVNTQPKTGYWFEWKPEDDVWRTTCSECGEETRTLWNYCPNCGAKMVDPQESEE